MDQRPPVWQMLKEAIHALNGKATYGELRDYLTAKYGDVNPTTVTCQTIICSVNHPSRIHYPENKKPRPANSKYDFLFHTGRGKVELYDPETHGQWEIKSNEYGGLEVVQSGLTEDGDDEIEPPETCDLSFPLESHLRDFIAKNLAGIRPDLHLYQDGQGRDGVEYPTDVGPIDILAADSDGGFVVFELKLSKGADRALGQLLRYMGWIQKHKATGKTVSGVIVAGSIDEKLRYAVSPVPNVSLFEYRLRFELSSVALSDSSN